MNIMVALIVTGATMSMTVPNIIQSKAKAIGQNQYNYEVQINNTVESFGVDAELNGNDGFVMNATNTGFSDEFKAYAFKGKSNITFPKIEGSNVIDGTLDNNGGWAFVDGLFKADFTSTAQATELNGDGVFPFESKEYENYKNAVVPTSTFGTFN